MGPQDTDRTANRVDPDLGPLSTTHLSENLESLQDHFYRIEASVFKDLDLLSK